MNLVPESPDWRAGRQLFAMSFRTHPHESVNEQLEDSEWFRNKFQSPSIAQRLFRSPNERVNFYFCTKFRSPRKSTGFYMREYLTKSTINQDLAKIYLIWLEILTIKIRENSNNKRWFLQNPDCMIVWCELTGNIESHCEWSQTHRWSSNRPLKHSFPAICERLSPRFRVRKRVKHP
jgi:hypothetical protein